MMKSSDIHNNFVNYFKKHNHTHIANSSLIPKNNPTLLFANTNINQFKNYFLGLEKHNYTQTVTSQKYIHTNNKHNDLNNINFTTRHHTFFEMLGNFSFGDYFKKEAIHFAWDFLTNDLKIPKDKLYVTVFETDDEAADIWHKQEGVPKDRIFRLGEKDNFWRMGDVGPCGPCSEIFYDHGPQYGTISDPYKGIVAGEDRYIEIWNLVFMQFYEDGKGGRTTLPKPSVDTGAGLERVVAAVQGRHNNYKTDLFEPMINKAISTASLTDLSRLYEIETKVTTDANYLKSNPQNTKAFKQLTTLHILTNHNHSVSFLLANKTLPSNKGHNYVLRHIIHHTIHYKHKLSTSPSFLSLMSEVLIEQMSDFYPELKNRKAHILTTIKEEESRFLQTLDNGTVIFQEEIKKLKQQNGKTISGETVFKLYDTYGFPIDLTALMAAEESLQVNEAAFEKQMQAAKEKAKSS